MNRETGTKILLIGSFAASLVLPTLVYPAVRSHLDQQNYENRELASFPELSAANFDNIPTEFEAYYNDHVPFKNLFVKAKTKLDLELLNESSISDVTVGKENWLFYTVSEDGEDALADYQRTNLYTADEKTALADAITSVNEKMKERGIRFVMFEAPNKESVYAEYMPDSVRVYGSESRLDAALPELAAQGLITNMIRTGTRSALLSEASRLHRLCLEPRHRSVQSRLRRQDRRPETWRGCLTWQQSTATIPNM